MCFSLSDNSSAACLLNLMNHCVIQANLNPPIGNTEMEQTRQQRPSCSCHISPISPALSVHSSNYNSVHFVFSSPFVFMRISSRPCCDSLGHRQMETLYEWTNQVSFLSLRRHLTWGSEHMTGLDGSSPEELLEELAEGYRISCCLKAAV